MNTTVNGEPQPVTTGHLPPGYSSLWKKYNDLRDGIAALIADLDKSAAATMPSKKSAIEYGVADQLRDLLEAEPGTAATALALLDHETRLTWDSQLPGERTRVAAVRERAGLEAL